MAEFPDLLINPNPNAPTLDASGNQVRGVNIFETTAERDALNITVRIPGALAVIKGSDELYQYTASTVDDTAWQDASNWLGVGSAGGSGVQNLNNLDGNLTLVGAGGVTIGDDGISTITITGGGGGGGGVTDIDGETGSVTFTGTGAVDVDVITGAGQVDLDLTDTGVTAGTYTNATVQVDAQGRVLTATSGTGGGGVTDINGEVGAITLTAGDGIDIVTTTGDIEISSTGGSTEGIDLSFVVRDAAYASEGDHEGTVFNFGVTSTLSVAIFQYNGTTWTAAGNESPSTAKGLLGMGLGNDQFVLERGIFSVSTQPPSFTAGDVLYLGTTTTTITNDISTLTQGEVARVVGVYLGQSGSVYKTYFNPSPDWIEIA